MAGCGLAIFAVILGALVLDLVLPDPVEEAQRPLQDQTSTLDNSVLTGWHDGELTVRVLDNAPVPVVPPCSLWVDDRLVADDLAPKAGVPLRIKSRRPLSSVRLFCRGGVASMRYLPD